MPKTYSIGGLEYERVGKMQLQNAIRIYQHWKQLDAEVRTISTRGVNFPCELSELFACYTFEYLWKKQGGGDAYDIANHKVIEIKGSGSENDDLSSFSPTEQFDELIFVKVIKNDDIVLFWKTGIDSAELKTFPVNARETVGDQQLAGRRPRFSIQSKIIRARGLEPSYKLDILNKEIIEL